MDFLTPPQLTLTIPTLAQQVPVWGESHKKKMPVARLINRLRFQMQKIYFGGRYQGSFGSHGYLSVSLKPNNVHRQVFERIKRCPQSFKKEVNHNVTA